MRRLSFAPLAICVLAALTLAADVPAPRPDLPLKPPQLLVQQDGKTVPLQLAKAQISTVITGFLAETTELLTFRNDSDRVLEGQLDFPLPEGAVVSGYGLDVDGVIVDGVPVPKQEARVTFEKEVRKGVDPGLLEQTAGNGFRTSVYPIRPHADRTVKVQFVADLGERPGAVSYRLPLRWGKEVAECTVRVQVNAAWEEPQILGNAISGLTLTKQGEDYVGEATVRATPVDADVVVSLGNPPAQQTIVEARQAAAQTIEQIENGPATQPADKPQYYFAIHDLTPAPAQQEARQAVHATKVGVFWDVSLNRAAAGKDHELALLSQIVAKVGATEVDLIPFSDKPQPMVKFQIDKGDTSALTEKIKSLIYDGGKNLSLLSMPNRAHDSTGGYDLCLLFTDGLVNLGEPMPHLMEVPVYPFTNDARADHALLRRIAAESGGAAFNLLRMTDEQVLAAFDGQPWSLLSVDVTKGDASDIYPKGHQPAAGRLTIAGKLNSPEATVVLHYGWGTKTAQSVSYTLKQEGATNTGLAPRCWAQMKVADLSTSPEANGDALTALGRDFNLVTPNTSLLVLENVQQYLTYRIVPPRSRPDVYAAFVEQIHQQAAAKKQTQEQRLATVIAEWNDRVQWWEKKYDYPKDFKWTDGDTHTALPEAGSGGIGRRGVFGHAAGRAVAPVEAAPMAPRAAEATDRAKSGGADDAVVTANPAELGQFSGAIAGAAGGIAPRDERASTETISIQPWNPDTPYLQAMQSAGTAKAYSVYLDQRKDFGAAPAFFVDASDYFFKNHQRELGVRVLTNVVALKLSDPELLRIAAYKLKEQGELNLAIDLFTKVMAMRPEEPQSYRDLALALETRADSRQQLRGNIEQLPAEVVADYTRALELLNKVVTTPWDRFQGIEVIALEEANQIVAKIQPYLAAQHIAVPIDARLLKLLDMDVRIAMTWDTDATDVDLWVSEPTGEKCFYGHNRTTIGGLLSNDFTQGYGPEEYCLRHAMPGKYLVQANFYGDHNQSVHGPTTVQATVITHFGRPDEKREVLTFRLTKNQEVVDLGTITVGQ